MATIKDVAKAAGVSTATVSRTINNNYPVHEDTRLRVNQAIEALNFKPNAVARGLKNKQTFLVGMITPDLSNPYFMEVAKGIESQIAQAGYNIIFCSSDEMDTQKELQMLNMFHERQVDAVILDTRNTKSDAINLYVDLGMKIVMIDAKLKGVKADIVTENNYDITKEAMTYVIEQGHKKMAVLKGNMNVSTAVDRYQAFCDALSEHGLLVEPTYCLEGGYNSEAAYKATMKLLTKSKVDLPTFIFSSNNRMTEGLLMALKEKNIRIPEDISVLSFGDINLSQLVLPKLTVIRQSPFEMGVKAGELLLKRLNHSGDTYHYGYVELSTTLHHGNSITSLIKSSKDI